MLKPDPTTRVARYETTADEFRDVIIQVTRAVYGPRGKYAAGKQVLYWIGGALIYGIIFLVFGVLATQQGWYDIRDFFLVSTAAAVAALLVLKSLGFWQLRGLGHILHTMQWDKHVEVFADAQGLTWATADQLHHAAWHRITKVVPHLDGYLFVYGVMGMPAPGRAFETAEARQSFDDLMARYLPAGLM
jgi:hypothetical protein